MLDMTDVNSDVICSVSKLRSKVLVKRKKVDGWSNSLVRLLRYVIFAIFVAKIDFIGFLA